MTAPLHATIVLTVTGPVIPERVADCTSQLAPGGLLFVYGAPRDLAGWGEQFNRALTFKYWIALDLDAAPRADFLKPTHHGLLLYWKPGRPFALDTQAARVPHAYCSACGKTVKDWGGKKHQMNPNGTALSDVWRDLPRRSLKKSELPADVAERIHKLAGHYHLLAA